MDLTLVIPAALGGPSGGSIYNDRLAAALGNAGHRVKTIAVPGAWPNGSPRDHETLAAAIRQEPVAQDSVVPDSVTQNSVVLVDGIMASAAPEAISTAVNAGITVWVLVHLPLPAETGLTEQEMTAFATSEKAALHHASGVISTSNWARDDLIRRYRLDRVRAVLPGTEPAALATGSTPPHLLMLGSLTPRKNHSMVLSALAGVADLQWTAALVGGASQGGSSHARRLHSLAERFEPGRITFPGVLQRSALDAEWGRTDLLLLPSVAETFGMVITEGLARGIPGVVGAGTGAVEALTGHAAGSATGLGPVPTSGTLPGGVVDPHVPEQLAALLREWLTDATVRRSWRTAALRRRDTLPTWANTATTLLNIVHP
ncbi:glycosyltransferase family 4 protein [Arthrobacter sp. H20]|uniref:glycosyltransferase family 4 protein n=1 Tax=Arthrobacter sp. H20 TaxID=1267981 RepID=UPI00047D0541|nr:glycosyltransferase family 4 protein [Arthrobacter sp. H20]